MHVYICIYVYTELRMYIYPPLYISNHCSNAALQLRESFPCTARRSTQVILLINLHPVRNTVSSTEIIPVMDFAHNCAVAYKQQTLHK